MNRYVVLARFDKNTEEKLIALRREMTNAGYASSEWPPHITLAAYEDLDAEALATGQGSLSANTRAKAGVRLCEPSAAVCHAPRNRRAVPESGTRKAFCRFLLCVPRKIRVVLQRHRQFLLPFRRTSPSSTVRSALCALRSCRTRSSSSSKMMFSPKPKLPRWRSTPIPCASSNGLT